MRRPLALLVLALLLALPPALAGALGVNEVARELRCPTCNSSLDVSNAPVALDMKEFIRERIDDGWNKQQIIDAMVEDFGEEILATPPKSGFGLTAWLVPALVTLLGLVMVPVLTRAWARRRREASEVVPELTAEQQRLIDAELGRRGEG